ncbi:lysosomal integral membrane protein II [Heterostelium album PN500]|uniref:Lysosomal integral membrane protein II n=1 Tax=Heterostelium pallidum (strain ATCC 26659 / Pp 5 / PN500) TaxID=670386 RepID=D3B610_HETP5|nr:lysosomal integral membrane protein II [Heterostelium album PN500]EFA83308.1 lysosomal integral membrane protein II [Heterostelium album PN500]|eukprot:XP_020435425.1 lysosomal integral membrane protein II [Heterostelium album PN500]
MTLNITSMFNNKTTNILIILSMIHSTQLIQIQFDSNRLNLLETVFQRYNAIQYSMTIVQFIICTRTRRKRVIKKQYNTMNKGRLCQLISIIVGLVLVAGGIIVWYVVNDAIHQQVEDASVALPENNKNPDINPWLRFLTNIGDENNQRTYTFYVYNLTNPDDFLNGQYPIYEEVGPYSFWSYYKALDYKLIEGDTKISYKDWSYYTEKEQLDPGTRDPRADVITHFNLAYFAVVQAAGGETPLGLALSANVMSTFWKGVNAQATFTQIQSAFMAINSLKFLGAQTGQIMTVTGSSATDVCNNYWLAAVNPNPIPANAQIPGSKYYPIGNNKGIATASCEILLNVSGAYPFGLFDKNQTNQLVMLKAIGRDPTYLPILKSVWANYGITSTQADTIIDYIKTTILGVNVLDTAAFAAITGCATCSYNDALYFQMATSGGYLGTTVMKLDPNPALPSGPEFGYMMNVTIPVPSMKYLMNATNPFNFLTPQGMGAILKYVTGGQWQVVAGAVGTNEAQTKALAAYIDTFMTTFVKNFVLAQPGIGLIGTHTVYDFLFNMTDPLLKLVKAADGPAAWRSNVVSITFNETEAEETLPTELVYTGKGDVNRVLAPITYDGSTNYTYNATFQVEGNSPEQLGPYFLAETDEPQVAVFSSDFARTLHFEKVESGALSGLPYYRYRIAQSDWEPNPDMYMSIPYVLNMTATLGKPVHFTRPRMLGLNVAYLAKCGLQDFAYTTVDNDVFADYEPRTGKAIRGRYSLQANAYIPGTDREISPLFNRFTGNGQIYGDVFHPLFWGKKEVVALPNQIDAILFAYKMDGLRYGLTILLIAGGGFLILGSIGLYLFEHVKEKIL